VYVDPDGYTSEDSWISLSPGHGLLGPKNSGGGAYYTGKEGIFYEVSYIYRFTKRLQPKLKELGFGIINIKASPYKAYTASEKIRVENKLYGRKNNVPSFL
jgi:hypothetical protein